MALKTSIVDVSEDNLDKYPQVICFINRKHPLYPLKIEWLKEQYKKGLKVKLLFLEGEKKAVGFVEYIPGEECWRAVSATGYMFIHCLWTSGKKYQHQGLGKLLLDEVEADAGDRYGVAVVTSDKSFMVEKDIFLKNGYRIVAESGYDQLLVKSFRAAPAPSINNWQDALSGYEGLTAVYSRQCPWVARFIEECRPVLEQAKLELNVIELKTAQEAQNGPSLYGVFNLIYNGRLLADRYISTTRFRNIINKELKIR